MLLLLLLFVNSDLQTQLVSFIFYYLLEKPLYIHVFFNSKLIKQFILCNILYSSTVLKKDCVITHITAYKFL